jgi:2-acylglycerol O-acyltransferase 1
MKTSKYETNIDKRCLTWSVMYQADLGGYKTQYIVHMLIYFYYSVYRLLQDVFIVLHTTSLWWMPVVAICLLLIPYLRFPWLLWNLYSLSIGHHEEKSSFPFYYHYARQKHLFDLYRDFYADYFPVKLYRSAPLPPTRKYVFGYHPHGIGIRGMAICFGMQASGFAELFPGLRTTFHVTSTAFKVPLWRSHLQLMGCKSVSRTSCVAQLTSGGHDSFGMGNGVVISVGGAREAKRAHPDSMDVVVKIRKGFIRVAVETGADIVPVMAFGENDIWDRVEPNGGIRERILKFLSRFPSDFKLHQGRLSVVLPYKKPINVVVGTPITVEQQESPDPDYVDKLHGQYLQVLKQIWDDWRDDFKVNKAVEFRVVE